MVASSEYKLRQFLFNKSLPYDKNVRPMASSLKNGKMEVYFNLRLNKIVNVVSNKVGTNLLLLAQLEKDNKR